MNYIQFRRVIVAISVGVLFFSCVLFLLGIYVNWPNDGGDFDLQGASGLAVIIPSFAGVIVASIALFSYIKIEDPNYRRAVDYVTTCNHAISFISTVSPAFTSGLDAVKMEIERHKPELLNKTKAIGDLISIVNLQVFADNLEAVLKDLFIEKRILADTLAILDDPENSRKFANNIYHCFTMVKMLKTDEGLNAGYWGGLQLGLQSIDEVLRNAVPQGVDKVYASFLLAKMNDHRLSDITKSFDEFRE